MRPHWAFPTDPERDLRRAAPRSLHAGTRLRVEEMQLAWTHPQMERCPLGRGNPGVDPGHHVMPGADRLGVVAREAGVDESVRAKLLHDVDRHGEPIAAVHHLE